jgi:hypothetical protein
MSDEQVRVHGESESLWAEVLDTSVGRRGVLKAGLASAAALGLGSIGAPDAEAAPSKRRRRVETTDLQFALSHVRGVTRLTLQVNGERMALKRHTKASRDAMRRRGGLWQAIDLAQLTHHVDGVKLPSDRGLIVSVIGKRGRREVLVAQLSHAPRAAVLANARRSLRAKGSFKHVVGSSQRLTRLGLQASDLSSAQRVAQLATVVDEWTTAVGLTSYHPNIANATLTTETNTTLSATVGITTLANSIKVLQRAGKNVADFPTATNQDGKTPATISIPVVENGTVVGHTPTTFTTFRLNPQNDASFARAVKAGLVGGILAVRNDPNLGAVIAKPLEQDQSASRQTWVQPQGILPQSQTVPATGQLGAAFQPTVKNPGVVFGTQTVANSGFTASQVPLTLHNNWVRWVWVYVQYIGKDGENLSADPNATFPDTKYARSLGLLPQVFTVLGIPVWGQNSIDVTLNFPQGAHTARLLFCGLGSNLLDGGWRQYFPADAYLDASGNPLIAPTGEVLVASLITGILTIGLTAFALATDLDIAATWGAIRGFEDADSLVVADFEDLVSVLQASLTAAETVALSLASGGATYADISANGGSTANIWSILLQLASVIPKIIFNPALLTTVWFKVAARIAGITAAQELIKAIPYVGQVIAVIEAVGDAITLGEACDETIVAPWVIENEVTLTYPATITIEHDPDDATFPVTATSYQLEAKVDGAIVFDPITGTVNPGGVAEPGPLALSVTAPFGGQLIQWSVVFLNARGQQVGTGVSPQFINDDVNNVPSAVKFAITELEVPIDSMTAFRRAVTTGYSSKGYTWSDQIIDTGTVASNGIQQVVSTTVATVAGVAGVVWEQGDLYYVRGVPVGQSGATISLGKATNEGYARRPFLLLDSFVAKADQGNHVLLEPDPSTTVYHVRKVTLDPTTGAPTWDPTISYGDFQLPISAAALHSSGRVVVVETANSRLGTLLPAAPPIAAAQVGQASYGAGPGTQVGLLSSPLAIAVTNPGTVLVLEAAGAGGQPQISAFDLNANPVQYFQPPVTRRSLLAAGRRRGAGAAGQYTLPLVSAGTYLDLAVDGSEQIYVLYYTGSGDSPGDYHVDVYTLAGAVVNNHIVGVNVPHLAVDYWRSIYAANFDPQIAIGTNTPHIDSALKVAEPSVSRFDPEELITLKSPKKRKHKPKHKHKQKPEHKHKHKLQHKHKPEHKHKHKKHK